MVGFRESEQVEIIRQILNLGNKNTFYFPVQPDPILEHFQGGPRSMTAPNERVQLLFQAPCVDDRGINCDRCFVTSFGSFFDGFPSINNRRRSRLFTPDSLMLREERVKVADLIDSFIAKRCRRESRMLA